MLNLLSFSLSLLLLGCEPAELRINATAYTLHCLETGSGQSEMDLADVNGDGFLDLLVVTLERNELILFLGDGTGRLTESARYPAGENPSSVDAADLNNDGHADVLIANHETAYLTMLTGDGTGMFKPAPYSPLGISVAPHPHMAAAMDVDNDGYRDILVDHRSGKGVWMVKGTSDGTFKEEGSIMYTGGDPYRGFAAGDLNGDQRVDFVTPNPGDIGITLSTESDDEPFAPPIMLPAGSPFAVGVSDLNGDGFPDVIAASNDGRNPVFIFFGQENGQFDEKNGIRLDMAAGAKQIATGDINGDGTGDAIVSTWNGEVLVVSGSATKVDGERIEVTPNPWGIAVGDLNGDGKDDIVIGDGVASQTRVLVSH